MLNNYQNERKTAKTIDNRKPNAIMLPEKEGEVLPP
jgi:hypothetical protein